MFNLFNHDSENSKENSNSNSKQDPKYDLIENIRDNNLLGSFIGLKIIDITQTDKDELDSGEQSQVHLLFENGNFLTFNIDKEGFMINCFIPDDDPEKKGN